jgi:hypothetical protein
VTIGAGQDTTVPFLDLAWTHGSIKDEIVGEPLRTKSGSRPPGIFVCRPWQRGANLFGMSTRSQPQILRRSPTSLQNAASALRVTTLSRISPPPKLTTLRTA